MNELGPGDHLPPERDHVRWACGMAPDFAESSLFIGSMVVCKTYDEGAADRAAALYAKTILKVLSPRVKRHGVFDHDSMTKVARDVEGVLKPGTMASGKFDAVYVRPLYRDDRKVVTRRRPKGIQAKHVHDLAALQAVYDCCLQGYGGGWTDTHSVAEQFPRIPFKVVAAKLWRLLQRGLLTGCGCGCRGDWELTSSGYALLGLEPIRENPMESA